MILEERRYDFRPGMLSQFWQLYSATSDQVDRPMVGNLMGYFQDAPEHCESVTLLLKYRDYQHRSEQYAKLQAIAATVADYTLRLHSLMIADSNRILVPVVPEGAPIAQLPDDFGYLRDAPAVTYTIFEREVLTVPMSHLHQVTKWFATHAPAIAEALGTSLIGIFLCEIGPSNTITIYRRYRDSAHRSALQAEFGSLALFRDHALSVVPLLHRRQTDILLPAPVPKLTPLAYL